MLRVFTQDAEEIIAHNTVMELLFSSWSHLHNAQWESVLGVGGQHFAQIGNYFTIQKFQIQI